MRDGKHLSAHQCASAASACRVPQKSSKKAFAFFDIHLRVMSREVRDRAFFILTFCYRGCRISMWFAGLPAAFLRLDVGSSKASWRQPTCREGAGYNLVPTASGIASLTAVEPVRMLRAGSFYSSGPVLSAFLSFFSLISGNRSKINAVPPLRSRKNSCIMAW